MKKILKGFILVVFFTSCKKPTSAVRQITENAPMNPVVAYLYKEDLALKGPVKMAGDDHFDKHGNITKSMTDTFTHNDTKSTMKTGDILYTYLKNKSGQFVEMIVSGSDESTFYTYHSSGLLATEYGIEKGIPYKTSYDYDVKGRITKYTYSYGKDPIQIQCYTYKELENNFLEIIVDFKDSNENEIYQYKNGIIVASTQNGITSTYHYKFDEKGNWITQTADSGRSTKRNVTYYK